MYITVRQSPVYRQMTLEEFLFGGDTACQVAFNGNITNTRTYWCDRLSYRFSKKLGYDSDRLLSLIAVLQKFNRDTAELRKMPRRELYTEFFIPKRSGGLRKIDAPVPELMDALRDLKKIFEEQFGCLYHTSAYAYIKGRCTIDAIKKHQANESRWFAKYDLSDFFGSTTIDFAMEMLQGIFPFSEVCKYTDGKSALRDAIELAFLDGGLPQGTPLSPLITNVIMIPIDFTVSNKLRDFEKQRYIYTRYADDFLISSRYDFDFRQIEKVISETLEAFHAPFRIKHQKTRYGSSSGANWNLGVMLNAENQITIGYKKKRRFEAMLRNYAMDKKNGVQWSKNDVQVLDGHRAYYKMVEGDAIDKIVDHVSSVLGIDIARQIKEDLRA